MQGSDWSLDHVHGSGPLWRCFLDSISHFQGEIRCLCVGFLRGCNGKLSYHGHHAVPLNIMHLQAMDMSIVVAALVLNPIARRKRAVQTSELMLVAEASIISVFAGHTGGPDSPEKPGLGLGGKSTVAV